MVDRTTRWPEVHLLKSTTAQCVADAFVATWVSRYGVPEKVTTDRGPQFLSGVWACLCRTLGIQHKMTTAYHPQANGLVERFHRQLKEALRARESGLGWAEHLPWVLLGLRAAPKEEAAVSAAEVVLGAPLHLPGPVVPGEKIGGEIIPTALPQTYKSYAAAAAAAPPERLQGAARVLVARDKLTGRPLAPSYTGPFEVLERRPKAFKLRLGAKEDWVSVDRLKRFGGDEDATCLVEAATTKSAAGGVV